MKSKLFLCVLSTILVMVMMDYAIGAYTTAGVLIDAENKCVTDFINSGVERINISILEGTGTCKNLITGEIK